MKLLIQHRHFADEISGVLTYINTITPVITCKGIEVKIISTKKNHILDWLRCILWADMVHMNSNNLLFALICKAFLKKIIIKYHYTFYQSTHTNYIPMSWKSQIISELKYSLPKSNYPLKWKLHVLVKWMRLATRLCTTFLADYHTACSRFLASSCVLNKTVDTLYNPILIPTEFKSKNVSNLSTPYKFIFVGRLDPDKGVDILLRAVKILRTEGCDFEVVIVGDGSNAVVYKQMTDDLVIASAVKFMGKLTTKEVLLEMESALALIVPSRWNEPAGYVSLEASSVGTCSIVSLMGGLPEIAGPHSLYFDNENISQLASCMRYCIENPCEVINRGLLSRQYVSEKFSPTVIAESLLSICNLLNPEKL